MASDGKNDLDIETANSQRPDRDQILSQAEEEPKSQTNPSDADSENPLLEMGDSADQDRALESEILDALNERKAKDGDGKNEHAIDDQLIANLGSGKNDYGVAESLLPQIDFDIIPLTQPKRVMAKSDPNGKGVHQVDEVKADDPPSRALKRKKKPASLLDSYFKGI